MTSFAQSLVNIEGEIDLNHQQHEIMIALKQYSEEYIDQQDQNKIQNRQDFVYSGFQNKKTIKIKPIKMYKDFITLKKQNQQKLIIVQNLEKLRSKLKIQYQNCIQKNKELQSFLKQVQFTFQHDYKGQSVDQVMIRTKKTLNFQARQAKQRLLKMMKNSQASNIQQIKTYIKILQQQKVSIYQQVSQLKQLNLKKLKQADFNKKHAQKFQQTCQKIKEVLQYEFQKSKKNYNQYKIQRLKIKNQVKFREYQAKKKTFKQLQQQIKSLLFQQQGLEYQLFLLKNRIKDKKKQNIQYKQLQQKIVQKETNIIRLEKELREKNKTYDYMLQWTKQLKKQLEDRKTDHAKKKAFYQQQINSLSQSYEKYNQKYKTGLFQQQVAKRKGQKDQQIPSIAKQQIKGRQISYLQIKNIAKHITFTLFDKNISILQFIQQLMKFPQKKFNRFQNKQHKRSKLKTLMSFQQNIPKQNITLNQLTTNIFNINYIQLSKEDAIKFCRFIVQDGNGKSQDNSTIPFNIARQILKNSLKRQIASVQQFKQAALNLKNFLNKYVQSVRHDLKIGGGGLDQIMTNFSQSIFFKYGVQPYFASLFTQFIQFYGWKKRKSVSFFKLQDFDQVSFLMKHTDIQQIQQKILVQHSMINT